MAHAETCPVCGGSGRTEKAVQVGGIVGTTVRKSQPCHGCNGKGWIEVGDSCPTVPWGPYVPDPWPIYPYYPYITYYY